MYLRVTQIWFKTIMEMLIYLTSSFRADSDDNIMWFWRMRSINYYNIKIFLFFLFGCMDVTQRLG
jgi:hypothetical protein